MLRLFAGLSLPDAVTARLALTQPGLPGRPVAPETMHLTLAFFGETDEATAGDLHAALGAVRCPGFDLWLDGVGAFGGARPRSIHALARPEPLLSANPLRAGAWHARVITLLPQAFPGLLGESLPGCTTRSRAPRARPARTSTRPVSPRMSR